MVCTSTQCMWSVVEYLRLNPACTRGWFSSSVFSTLFVITFMSTLYIFDNKYIRLIFLRFFFFPFLKTITILVFFHAVCIRLSDTYLVYSLANIFEMVYSLSFNVSMLIWSLPIAVPFSYLVMLLPPPLVFSMVPLFGSVWIIVLCSLSYSSV